VADIRNIARLSLLALAASIGGSACLTGRAQTPTERPALEVPEPPARVVAQGPPPPPVTPVIDPVEDIPSNIKPSSPTKPNRPPVRPQDTKQEPKPEAPPVTTEQQPPAQTPAPVATPQLKLPESVDPGVMSRQIRDMVERTRRTLGGINRARLTSLRQRTFDDAESFLKQAEDALNEKNLAFAKEVADKAERLAKELQSR
jgi:outer membrane biosynthesis protein TonB